MDRTAMHALHLVRLLLVGVGVAVGLVFLSTLLSSTSASASSGTERTGLLDGVGDVVGSTVGTVGETVSNTTSTTTAIVEKTVEKVVKKAGEKAAPVVVPAPAKPVVEAVAPVVAEAAEVVTDVTDTAAEVVDSTVETAPTPAGSVVSPITETADDLVSELPVVGGVVTGLLGSDPLTGATDDVVDAIDRTIVDDILGSIREVVSTVGDVTDAVVDPIVDAVDPVLPAVPALPGPPLSPVPGGALGATAPLATLAAATGGRLLSAESTRSGSLFGSAGGTPTASYRSIGGPGIGAAYTVSDDSSAPVGAPSSSPADRSVSGAGTTAGVFSSDAVQQFGAPGAAAGSSAPPADEVLPSSLSSRTLPSPD